MKKTLAVIFFSLLVASVSAIQSRTHGRLSMEEIDLQESSVSSCYYNLFLTNFESADGFGGASVTVLLDGRAVEGVDNVTLPTALDQSGWVVPVTAGSHLTITYSSGDNESYAGNRLLVTDANAVTMMDKTMTSVLTHTHTIYNVTCECVYPSASECSPVRVRNEWRSLSYCQKKQFINALNTLRNSTDASGKNMYEKFALHHEGVSSYVLARSLLLPWHRGFILQLENALRALGGDYACVSLPYWDSSLDFGYESSSSIYDDLGGMSLRSCLAPPFEFWTDPVALGDSSLSSNCVYRRVFPDEQTFEQFPTAAALDLGVVGNKHYEYIFRYLVRNPHKSVHLWVSGTMGTLHSPADPLFFLHHANIDRIYAMWQDCWGYDDVNATHAIQYNPNVAPSSPAFADNIGMPPTFPDENVTLATATVHDMLDIYVLGYTYPPMTRTLTQLKNTAAAAEPEACHWDWMSKDRQDEAGMGYRLAVHNEEQRNRLAKSRAKYNTHLESTPLDYYGAVKAQMDVECTLNGGYLADDFNDEFMDKANHTATIGPGDMFKNACKILNEGNLDLLIATCYPGLSC